MDWNDHAALWNYAWTGMMDIRHLTLRGGEAAYAYRLPSSGFLYVSDGQAAVRWGTESYEAKRHHLLHGGKGTRISITPSGDWFSYYLILYKASLTDPRSRTLQRLYEQTKPFDQQYVCSLSQASLLQGQLADMIEHWRQSLPLDKLRVKATFYQFVYELMRMLAEHQVTGSMPDPVQLTVRYLREHYREPVTVDELATMFNCSVTHLSRLFKKQIGVSPIHYLIQLRMEQAKALLLDSEAGLKDIAGQIGYPDGFYFSRMFKKHTGYSPQQYRNRFARPPAGGSRVLRVPDRPCNMAGIDMAHGFPSLYTDNDNRYQQKEGENQMMQMYAKPSSIAMTMLLCLTLLLGACQSGGQGSSTATTTGSAANTASTAAQQPAAANETAAEPTTRMFKHIDGETEIPVKPKRVFTDLKVGQLMAVGVKPIGSSTFPLQTEFFDPTGIEDLGKFPLNLEKLTALEPDLIILTEAWRDGGGYEAFSKIAPTVVIPNYVEDLAEELRMFGDMVGNPEEAERWIADFEAKVAESKKKVEAVIGPDETFSILNVRAKQFYIYDDANMGGNVIYTHLGLKPQEKVKTDVMEGEVWEISAEVIPE